MKNIIKNVIFFSLLLISSITYAGGEVSFKVIVNVSNPDSVLTKEVVSKLFLKKIEEWDTSGEGVQPVDLLADSPVRARFSEVIHGRGVPAIKAYWYKRIFSGRDNPPPLRKSDEEVLKYVSENIGAIGYISESAEIDEYEVKVVEIIEEE